MIHKSFNCNLNQLTSFSRGVLSDANSDGLFDTVASSSRTQAWNLDALGNWANLTTNSTSQSRTHNAQNQVTGVGSTSLSYDANGSMTADESGRVFVYEAWNRLVSVRNTANSPIVGYSYDALSRRIIENRPNSNSVDHLYYSTGWQVLEERRNGTASGDVRRQFFWSIDYVDALATRVDYASGAVSATYHAQYDANWNITAIADATSGVLERYIYDSYGVATVLYANWSARGGSPYGWNYLHQGGRLDVDSNLYHFRHRDYSATLGRWTQADPIGFDAADLNLYRYEENGPINLADYLGLMSNHQGRRPVSTPQAIRNAIQSGNKDYIETLLDINAKCGGFTDDMVSALESALAQIKATEVAAAAEIVKARLRMSLSQIIQKEFKGSIHEVFPKQFLNKTLEEVGIIARRGDVPARRALKLINDRRFKKGF